MKTISSENNQENALLWFIKLLAGGLILFILAIHLVVNHLVAPGGLFTFKDVVAYYQNPLVLVMEGFFLTFVLIHALLGLRSILLDLNPAPGLVKIINVTLTIAGMAALVYGIWLLITVSVMPVLP
jgi:succinate dehydrogenase hydrophobic anchor subunit